MQAVTPAQSLYRGRYASLPVAPVHGWLHEVASTRSRPRSERVSGRITADDVSVFASSRQRRRLRLRRKPWALAPYSSELLRHGNCAPCLLKAASVNALVIETKPRLIAGRGPCKPRGGQEDGVGALECRVPSGDLGSDLAASAHDAVRRRLGNHPSSSHRPPGSRVVVSSVKAPTATRLFPSNNSNSRSAAKSADTCSGNSTQIFTRTSWPRGITSRPVSLSTTHDVW